MYKGPWDGRCIPHSRDAVPTERASGMHLSIKEKMHIHRHKPITAMEDQALIPAMYFKTDNFPENTVLKLSTK